MEKEKPTMERRIRAIEDRLEIYNLIAGHPPSADTGNAAYAEAVFTADAAFDRGPDLSGAVGNKAIGANLQSAGHQAAISCRLSATGIRFLGILSRPGFLPPLRSAYRTTIGSTDPNGVSTFRTHKTRLG